MPILGSCCFCIDLKVGTKIIGILFLILSLIASLFVTGLLVTFTLIGVDADTVKYLHLQQSEVQIILSILLAICLLSVIASSMLIHGVRRNRRGLLVPFIIQEVLNLTVFIVRVIWALVVFGTPYLTAFNVIKLLVTVLIQVYFTLVVFSQYQALGQICMHEEISMK